MIVKVKQVWSCLKQINCTARSNDFLLFLKNFNITRFCLQEIDSILPPLNLLPSIVLVFLLYLI